MIFFFFNDTATTEIYTLSLHDALPIFMRGEIIWNKAASSGISTAWGSWQSASNPTLRDVHEYVLMFSKDRKSTRLNSSHANISYAVFCLKKKKKPRNHIHVRYISTNKP